MAKFNATLLGIIGRTDLDGLIGGQVWIRGGTLAVASTAQVVGPAEFHGREQPVVASGAKLASPIQVEITQEIRRSRRSTGVLVIHEIFSYGAALLAGILLVTVFPGFYGATLREARAIGLPIGVGALALLTGAFLIVLGILLLFVGVGAGIARALGYAPDFVRGPSFCRGMARNQDPGRRPEQCKHSDRQNRSWSSDPPYRGIHSCSRRTDLAGRDFVGTGRSYWGFTDVTRGDCRASCLNSSSGHSL